MKNYWKFTFGFILLCCMLKPVFISAKAVPVLPSSFYGTAKVDHRNIPEGTIIEAYIGDEKVGICYSQIYQGDSVYSINVTGNDTDTPLKDGGEEGDTIIFKIGGLTTNEVAIWHSGTNVQLNLTANAGAATIVPPQPTPEPLPTQTAISVPAESTSGNNRTSDAGHGYYREITTVAVMILVGGGISFLVWKRYKKKL